MEEPNGITVFLGDSLTEWFDLESYFPDKHIVNMGIAGDTSEGVLYRLDNITRIQPAKLFLMIGINDVFQGCSILQVSVKQKQIIESLVTTCLHTRIYIQSLLPVNESILDAYGINDKVKKLNQILEEYCREGQFEYISLYGHFLGRGGLNPEYTYDGAHLTGMGYRAWAELITKYLKK